MRDPQPHVDDKHDRIEQNHDAAIALHTETTINETTYLEIGRRLTDPCSGRSVRFI